MTRIPTRTARLADVAEQAGVSKATVSNVFNRPELVRAEVRDRVLSAAKTLNYGGPDPKGRLLSAGKVNAIGVATAEPLTYFVTDPFARAMMVGIAEVCDENGIGISLISAATERNLAWSIRSALVDGLLLFCLEGAERLILAARERHLPFVAIGVDGRDPSVSAVGVDDVAGAALAARHLLGLGHRHFAVLAMEFTAGGVGLATLDRVEAAIYPASRERVRGYFAALGAAGIDTRQVPIFETRSDAASVAAALVVLFDTPEPPTALLAESDRIAMIAMDWLAARGLSVPRDVSIIGFDGVPESAATHPPLTTMAQPIAEIGRRAVRVILDHPTDILREQMPVTLLQRGTTAPPIR